MGAERLFIVEFGDGRAKVETTWAGLMELVGAGATPVSVRTADGKPLWPSLRYVAFESEELK